MPKHTGQLWAYARDDRPWAGGDPPGVAYVYVPDHETERPLTHRAGFTGVLQVDGYGGYRALAERGDVELAFCWAMCAGASTSSPSPGGADLVSGLGPAGSPPEPARDVIRGGPKTGQAAASAPAIRPMTRQLVSEPPPM